MAKSKTGVVALVGAGPGDPGLLTRRGALLLERADVVVHDALVPPSILRLARAGAELIDAGKRDGRSTIPQDEIQRLLVDRAQAGMAVVRLKGGDPYLFGRGGEEASALAAASIPFEVVPGVSSFGAAASCAGIPLTHRGVASAFTVVSGHEDPGTPRTAADWREIARVHGTKVILMGMERLAGITEALAAGGLPPTTPAAVIQWGTTPAQRVVEGTLADIAAAAAAAGLGSPAVAVLGDVVRQRAQLNWFERRPLFGKRVVLPRTRELPGTWGARLSELGAEVLDLPTLRTEPPSEREPMIEALAGLGEYDWLLFDTGTAVDAFFNALLAAFDDIRALGNARLAALGPDAAARLASRHLRVNATPEGPAPADVAKAINDCETLENLRLLLVRGGEPHPDLTRGLEEQGAIIDDVSFHRGVPLPASDDPDRTLARLRSVGADWIVFPNSASVGQLQARVALPELVARHPGLRLASIGPDTTRALATLGLKPAAEARTATLEGLVAAMLASSGVPGR